MIYLDYSATTPISSDVLDAMNKTYLEFVGNPNSLHGLGKRSNDLLIEATNQISNILNVKSNEITFTSGATEANNMALIGVMERNSKRGKHLITSKLEHPSIYKICDYLKSIGYEISYVNNDETGLIDFEHLKSLIREDTILVSICAVNSETGVRQPLKMIRQIIKKENNNTYFHSDITQGIGKIAINIVDVDLLSLSAHKIYGPKGIGIFYKSELVKCDPINYGSGKSNDLKPGTPPLPLIVGLSKAMRLFTSEIEKRISFIERLNDKIVLELSEYDDILINKTDISIPQILNISVLNIMPEVFINKLSEYEIYIGTNTACASGGESTSVMAIYNDSKRSKHTLRISLSHMTTLDEVNKFLKYFKECYEQLKMTN